MTISFPRCSKTFFRLLSFALLIALCGAVSTSRAASPKAPTLLSQTTEAGLGTTRAIALESVTLKGEPFPLTSSVKFSSDPRTRVCIFAVGLELLPGEGVSAFSAEAEDSAGVRYPLTVEYVGQVPPATDALGNTTDFRGISMIVVRLNDAMGDLGDVLLKLNLHGMSSNRVRMYIGHAASTLPSDAALGLVPTPAPLTPPPADPAYVPDAYTSSSSSDADTVRLLEQATWGPTRAEIDRVKNLQGGFKAYLDEQFNAPVINPGKGSNYPDLFFPLNDQAQACPTTNPSVPNYNQAVCNRDGFSLYPIQRTYFSNALYGPDQLRQRVAFALHQIFVVSGVGGLNRASWMTMYLQALDRGAFGNYRTLLEEITLNSEMGEYLDMIQSTRTSPNENWAREVLQLFSIGINELNIDGTPKRDAQGMPIPSYSQTTVNEFTRVFTGWNLNPVLIVNGTIVSGTSNWRDPMVPRGGTQHDFDPKTLLNGFITPDCANTSGTVNSDCARADLTFALDNIFNHPNVGPFIGKQLIQHLVTSNPSPAYVERVARVFNNDCAGLYPIAGCSNARGNLKAVVQAILLDPEARGEVKTDPNYGKLREPAQYVNNILRAFNAKSFDKQATSDGVLGGRSSTDFTGTLDQPIFQPTTVFSYYQPDYEVPGTKILGPAFGILSTSRTLLRANVVNTLIYTGVTANTTPTPASPDRPRGTSLDLANLELLSDTPGAIADLLNGLMLHGTMSTQMRTSLINAIGTINDADLPTRRRKRAQTAAYLVATSSQYDIQR